jgi:membrane-associated protease RseP (regulator of RpoE activity)
MGARVESRPFRPVFPEGAGIARYRPARLLPAILFILTMASTTMVGARLEWNFLRGVPAYSNATDLLPFVWAWRHLSLLWIGLPFSLSLMAILLAHEMGHYLACQAYGIEASWPHFFPAPTVIGTMGAFIRIRSMFESRRQLFDVGVAGPLAGMAVTVPVLVWGIAHSVLLPAHSPPLLEFGWPPLERMVLHLFHPGWNSAQVLLSPVARAAWVGLFVTMLNLLPAAQLDGGHILYTFFPRLHRQVSWILVALLLLAGWRFWEGWYVWAGLILLMRVRHPWVPDYDDVGPMRVGLAILTLAIFFLTFIPSPIVMP